MQKINLISDVQEKKLEIKRFNKYATIFSAVLMLISIGSLVTISVITFAEKSIINSTKREIDTVRREISKYKDLEETVISLEKGLAGAKKILDGKNQWTKLFVHLEKAAPSDVKYEKLSLSSSEGTIKTTIRGKNIDSLARYIESHKNYKIITIQGTGELDETIKVTSDGFETQTNVMLDKTWKTAVFLNPNAEQTITVTKFNNLSNEPTTYVLKYNPQDKKVEASEGLTFRISNLFENVYTKGYTKHKGDEVQFSVDMNFDGEKLW